MAYQNATTQLGPGGGPRVILPQAVADTAISVPERQLALSPQPPRRDEDRTIVTPYAELRLVFIRGLNLNGLTPTISVSGGGTDITIPGTELLPDELDLAGQAPTLNLDVPTDVLDPGLDLAGQAPTLNLDVPTDVLDPGLDLAGKVPALDLTLVVPERDLSLTGYEPTFNWQISAPERDLVLDGKQPEAGVGLFTPTLEPGLDLTGYAPSFNWTVSVPESDLTLDGKQPEAGTGLLVPVETLALAGKVPTVGQTWSAAPTEETLALTGYAPSISPAVQVPEETLALTGYAPTVGQTWSAAPTEETLTLAGQEPAANVDHYPSPGNDALALTGAAPSLLVSPALPGEETLALAGQTPSIGGSTSRTPGALQLALSPQAPRRDEDRTITVPYTPLHIVFERGLRLRGSGVTIDVTSGVDVTIPGTELLPDTLVLAGQAPTLAQTWSAAPTEETLALDGKVPTVLASGSVEPATETLALAGQAPTVGQTWSAAPTEETLALTGYAPSVEEDHFVAVSEETLALTGQEPISLASGSEVPGAGSLTLAGQAPVVGQTYSVEPTVDTLTLVGYQPIIDDGGPKLAEPAAATLVLSPGTPIRRVGADTPITIPGDTLGLTGYDTTRAAGLLLYGYEPTVLTTSPSKAPAAGTLTLGTPAPNVINTSLPPIAVGRQILILRGTTPALEISQDTEESSLGLEGWTPTPLVTSPAPLVGSGALVLTGYAPEIPENRLVAPGAGSLSLAGQAPARRTDDTLQAGAPDTLTLSTGIPLVFGNPLATPGAGSLALTGQLAYYGRSITPPAIGRFLRGKQPTVFEGVNRDIVVPEDTLSLAGQAPVVNVGLSPRPDAADLTLTPQAPSVEEDHFIAIGDVELQLQGYVTGGGVTRIIRPLEDTLSLAGQGVRYKIKRIRKFGARTRFVSLTEKRTVRLLYD